MSVELWGHYVDLQPGSYKLIMLLGPQPFAHVPHKSLEPTVQYMRCSVDHKGLDFKVLSDHHLPSCHKPRPQSCTRFVQCKDLCTLSAHVLEFCDTIRTFLDIFKGVASGSVDSTMIVIMKLS